MCVINRRIMSVLLSLTDSDNRDIRRRYECMYRYDTRNKSSTGWCLSSIKVFPVFMRDLILFQVFGPELWLHNTISQSDHQIRMHGGKSEEVCLVHIPPDDGRKWIFGWTCEGKVRRGLKTNPDQKSSVDTIISYLSPVYKRSRVNSFKEEKKRFINRQVNLICNFLFPFLSPDYCCISWWQIRFRNQDQNLSFLERERAGGREKVNN